MTLTMLDFQNLTRTFTGQEGHLMDDFFKL